MSILALLVLACAGIGIYFIVKENRQQAQNAQQKKEYVSFLQKFGIDPDDDIKYERGIIGRMRAERDKIVDLVEVNKESSYKVLGYHFDGKMGSTPLPSPADLPYPVVKGNDQNGYPFYVFVFLDQRKGTLRVQACYQEQNPPEYSWKFCKEDGASEYLSNTAFDNLKLILSDLHSSIEVYKEGATDFYESFTASSVTL